jgi:hypothetical protein
MAKGIIAEFIVKNYFLAFVIVYESLAMRSLLPGLA